MMYESALLDIPRENIVINRSQGLYFAGFKGSEPDGITAERADRAFDEINNIIEPKVCYIIADIKPEYETVSFDGFVFRSRALAAHLSGCDRAVIFAATVGAAVDRAIAKRSVVSSLDGALLDAFGSAATEALCDHACLQFAKITGGELTARFSPGYGDLPLETGGVIIDFLKAQKKIGVSLTDGMMMVPAKSVTAIAGVR